MKTSSYFSMSSLLCRDNSPRCSFCLSPSRCFWKSLFDNVIVLPSGWVLPMWYASVHNFYRWRARSSISCVTDGDASGVGDVLPPRSRSYPYSALKGEQPREPWNEELYQSSASGSHDFQAFGESCTAHLKYISRHWLILLVWPSVWGWYAVLKLRLTL